MATVEELIKQYDTDPELKKEVDGILADQKITMGEFLGFAKKHDVKQTASMPTARRCIRISMSCAGSAST